jgi:hypothetical protein
MNEGDTPPMPMSTPKANLYTETGAGTPLSPPTSPNTPSAQPPAK